MSRTPRWASTLEARSQPPAQHTITARRWAEGLGPFTREQVEEASRWARTMVALAQIDRDAEDRVRRRRDREYVDSGEWIDVS